jgi:hypothetical protein
LEGNSPEIEPEIWNYLIKINQDGIEKEKEKEKGGVLTKIVW